MPRRVRRRPVQDPDAIEAEVVNEEEPDGGLRSDGSRRGRVEESEEEEPEILTPPRRRQRAASNDEPAWPLKKAVEGDEEEEEPAPRRKRRPVAPGLDGDPEEEEPEEPAPRTRRTRRAPAASDDEEEEDPTPAPKRRQRPAPSREDDPEEEEEEPRPKKKRKSTALAKKKDTQLAKKDTGWVDGDTDSDDFEIPSVKVLHPMSDLADDLPDLVGQWVYNSEIGMGKTLEVVLVNIRKRFQEVVDDYDPNAPPEVFETRADALEARVPVRPLAIVDMLITCPEGLEDEAMVEVDETPYLMARWYCRSGYRKFMGPLKNHELKRIDKTPWDRYFTITAVKRKGGKGRNWDPVLKPTEEQTSKALRSYISGMKN